MLLDEGSTYFAGNFPKSVCTSVNECVCHGIPDARKLEEGDIVNIDVTVYLNVRPQSLLSMMLMLLYMSFHQAWEHSQRAAARSCMC